MRVGAAGDEVIARHWRRLAVRRWGDPRGRPVFLLHGTPGSRLGVRPRQRDLRRLGVCLITYDRPGYGLSDPQHGRTVADAAGDVEFIADHFGYDRFFVLGRSGGGPHALACAALSPSRVAAVASLMGLAPFDAEGLDWFDGMNASNRAEYQAALTGRSALSAQIFPEVVAIRESPSHLVDRLLAEALTADQELLSAPDYRRALIENYAEAVGDCLDGWLSDSLAFIRPWQFDPEWIRTPTLLWHSRDDVYSPIGHARWLAARIPGAELRLADGIGHFDVMAAQLDAVVWLLEHDSGPRRYSPRNEPAPAPAGSAPAREVGGGVRRAPVPAESDDTPYFFLAYAHTIEQQLIKKLFRDLCTEIRERTAAPSTARIGFMDDHISLGADWRDSLHKALATCRTFVPMYSPRYFQREECGREWYAFRQRTLDHQARFGETPSAIVPGLWTPTRDDEMADAARAVHFDHTKFGAVYAEEGFYALIKNEMYRDEYWTAVQRLAKQIIRSADESRLMPCDPASFSNLRNAFAQPSREVPADHGPATSAVAPMLVQPPDGLDAGPYRIGAPNRSPTTRPDAGTPNKRANSPDSDGRSRPR